MQRRHPIYRTSPFLILIISLLLPVAASATQSAAQASDSIEPEQASSVIVERDLNKRDTADTHMVVAANPYASEAGLKILRAGGNAVDAMVTVQLILGLVEPQSSGLGGGAFTLFHDAKSKKTTAYDGRETAPLDATSELFLDAQDNPMGFFEAVLGGRSVGTPGTVALLDHMHRAHGELDWKDIVKPALELARSGFIVSPRLASAVARDQERLARDQDAASYFLPDSEAIQAGDLLKNPQYAETLAHISKSGASAFYQAPFAERIVKKVRNASNPGVLSLRDFAAYQVIERTPTCADFLSYEVCGMGPPSSGAVSVGQILMLSEYAGLTSLEPESPEAWQLVSDATRLAFADRGIYLADPSYFDVPTWLLDKDYLKQRGELIKIKARLHEAKPGTFDSDRSARLRPGFNPELPSTTHFAIIDREGNIVSSTSTIENGFGSRLMVSGFLLNNELTDFSFRARSEQGLIANRIEPGKRPRSSMAPSIVFQNAQPVLAIGSPGGSRIINYVANALIRILGWGQDPYEAINAPHYSNRFGTMDLEAERVPKPIQQYFEDLGYEINERDLNSGLHAILLNAETPRMVGAADERREGSVAGE